ncbi:SagB family peptide dehydrogenase [Malaciobacter mytili]|uniref:SagB family peptide dehydrogenase n=1 Tax=Malaciobacter mytili TaxID=603050 RepID=UPI003A8B6249
MYFNDFSEYHLQTKHSYFSVRNFPNRLDWNNQPKVFKSYKNFEKISLNLDILNHSFLYYIAGISAKKVYPGVEYYLRVNPSAGALYPNEIYFQSRNNDDIPNGIYHFDISSSSLTLLKTINNDGLEKYLGFNTNINGFIFFISSLYYRSSWKYKNRAFRYCLLDSGHLLGSLEASCYIFDKKYKIKYDFNKQLFNKLFNFSNEEFFQTCIIVGEQTNTKSKEVEFSLPNVDGTCYFEKNKFIEKAYKDSCLIKEKKQQELNSQFIYNKEIFKQIVYNRRSIREFSKRAIKKEEFFKILEILKQPICSDCDENVEIYCVINKVVGMPLGLYKDNKYLKEGDFKTQAGYLCLEQSLGKDSAVTFFLTSKGKNYQELYQKAGILGHRLYLVSNYLGYGCSGIGAYYDDEVCEFLEENSMGLYALAIGN